jgi:hypothetical protein
MYSNFVRRDIAPDKKLPFGEPASMHASRVRFRNKMTEIKISPVRKRPRNATMKDIPAPFRSSNVPFTHAR